jgi:hypothetical protein
MENVVRNKKIRLDNNKFNDLVEDAIDSFEEVVDRARFERCVENSRTPNDLLQSVKLFYLTMLSEKN